MSKNHNTNVFRLFIGSIIVAIIAGFIYYFGYVLPSGELGQKGEWAALQVLESENRNRVDAGRVIVAPRTNLVPYDAIGIPSLDKAHPYIWILLEEDFPDSV